MYVSNSAPILIDQNTKTQRTQIIGRLHGMNFNLIPMNGKKPCIEWKPYQTERVTTEQIQDWMRGRFPTKDGKRHWRAELLNFALLTGATPWSTKNPGIVVVDADDEQAEDILRRYCPETPMIQHTGSGGLHWVYRRPEVERIPNRQKSVIHGETVNLDVRGDGGYILCPGAIHPKTGRIYREETPWTLERLRETPVYDPSWIPLDTPAARCMVSVGRTVSPISHEDAIADLEVPVSERIEMASRYLAKVPGTKQGDGADGRCSSLTMKLLYGFALPAENAEELLVEWGEREDQLDEYDCWYPWTEEDIARKIDWCLEQEYRGEVGDCLDISCGADAPYLEIDGMRGNLEVSPTIDPKDPLAVADCFYRMHFTSGGKGTLIHHQAVWHHWTGKRYDTLAEDDIKARLWKWLASCKTLKKKTVITYQPTRNVVNGVLDALKAVANQPASLESPCWLTSGPSEVVAFENGLLDVESFLENGHGHLLSHTPDWFSSNCLPHPFDPEAACPKWLGFLEEVFDGDEERIQTLQQWFGYNLINDNRQHKLALLIGPPRSGKGTTMAALSAMLGKYNVANTSLASLGGRFGLEPLLGKLAALIDEGHLGKFSDTSQILERLKAISGGSEQTVDRKGIAALSNVPLNVRFTIAVNELPRLSDSSAAMRSRLLIIPYFNTYEGKEDFGLVDRLLTEVSGITNWAMEGLRLLRKAGRFQNPQAGEKILRDFVYLASPVQAFLDECCDVGDGKEVKRSDLQQAWHIWCEENGHVPGSIADFGRKLRAVFPRINDHQRRVNGRRDRWYLGIDLSLDARTDIDRRRKGAY